MAHASADQRAAWSAASAARSVAKARKARQTPERAALESAAREYGFKLISARFPSVCAACGGAVAQGAEFAWSPNQRNDNRHAVLACVAWIQFQPRPARPEGVSAPAPKPAAQPVARPAAPPQQPRRERQIPADAICRECGTRYAEQFGGVFCPMSDDGEQPHRWEW